MRQLLATVGVNLHAQHELERMIRDAEWLSTLQPDIWSSPARTAADTSQRFSWAVLRMEQLERLSTLLPSLHRVRNRRQLAKWLRSRVDRMDGVDDKNHDFLFEVDTAARLARSPLLDVSFEEPDIVVRVGGDAELALALKRPRRLKAVRDNLRDAKHQVRDDQKRAPGRGAVVLISMEGIFHLPEEDPTKTLIYDLDTIADARRIGYDLIDKAIDASREQFDSLFKEPVFGILYTGVMSFMCRRPSSYRNLIFRRRVTNDRLPAAQPLMAELDRIMFSA
jgi:hypothetical protein